MANEKAQLVSLPPAQQPPTGAAPAAAAQGASRRPAKYRFVRRLAIGGMAELFLARMSGLPGFQKLVVIKRILPQYSRNRDFVNMFLDEARIAATLQHSNLVQTYDVGMASGNYFMVMEYLHGETLSAMMNKSLQKGERLPLEHTLNVLIGVAGGLHYAHEQRGLDDEPLHLVHRDVTPQNIMVTYDGGVKLIDFGIAKASIQLNETRSGTLKGKIRYMSPEQARGEALDRRSDIFSLGVVMYEITLGKRLYSGTSELEVLRSIGESAIMPPRQVDSSYPAELEAIVMRALAKDPKTRYQTAREMQVDLEAFARQKHFYISSIALQGYLERLFDIRSDRPVEPTAGNEVSYDPLNFPLLSPERTATTTPPPAARSALAPPAPACAAVAPPAPCAPEPVIKREPAPRGRLGTTRAVWALLGLGICGLSGFKLSGFKLSGFKLLLRAHAISKPAVPSPRQEPAKPPAPAPILAVLPTPVAKANSEPEPPKTPTKLGVVEVRTDPPKALLFLDGRKLDQLSPSTLDRIEAEREHVLLVQLHGYQDVIRRFTIQDNEVADIRVHLHHAAPSVHSGEPKRATGPEPAAKERLATALAGSAPAPAQAEGKGTLVIASNPWCNVSVDGEEQGPTPLTLRLPAGMHTVVLTNSEFKIKRTLSVVVPPNETVRKTLEFGDQ